MTSSVKVNLSNLKGLKQRLQKATEELQVGWFASAKYDGNTPVAGIAALNEFGHGSTPARPFVRPAVSENQSKWSDVFASKARQFIAGEQSYRNVLTTVGLVAEADIRNQISGGNHAPLSPVTLALRRLKDDNVPIGGALVGAVAAAVADGQTGAGQLGEPSANQDPLRDTGLMLSTLTHEVTG